MTKPRSPSPTSYTSPHAAATPIVIVSMTRTLQDPLPRSPHLPSMPPSSSCASCRDVEDLLPNELPEDFLEDSCSSIPSQFSYSWTNPSAPHSWEHVPWGVQTIDTEHLDYYVAYDSQGEPMTHYYD